MRVIGARPPARPWRVSAQKPIGCAHAFPHKAPLPAQITQLASLNEDAAATRVTRDQPIPELDAAQAQWASEWASHDRWTLLNPGTVQEKEDGEKGGMTEFVARTTLADISALRLELVPKAVARY